MDIRADEISKIIREQIGSHAVQVDVAEVGTVVSIGDGAKYEVQLAADFLRSHGIAPQVRIEERVGAIAPRILEIALQQQAELLMLGCYGHSRLHELVFGSVTKAVLAETHVPLYLFH